MATRADDLLATAIRLADLVQQTPALHRKLWHLTRAALAYSLAVLLDPLH